MYAIHTFEQWHVVGFDKQGEQHVICRAPSLEKLLQAFTEELKRAEKAPLHAETLKTYKKIKVWNVDQGFTSLELPHLKDISCS
jgi:hypothetical protein